MDFRKTKREKWQTKKRKLKGHLTIGEYPRLIVFRSNKGIYAQIVDDNIGNTLASASSNDRALQDAISKAKSKVDKSIIVGEAIGNIAKEKKITQVIFDRNGYRYHGRVKALAEAARKTGLQF